MKKQIMQIIADNRKEFCQPLLSSLPLMENLYLLKNENEAEVLEFLSKRPVHTVVMESFIKDNGIESDENRGKFYGYRSSSGKLEGVALIGHSTLIEARSERSLIAFALQARESHIPLHLVMSDSKTTERFWKFYADNNRAPRLACEELLFEINYPFPVRENKWDVRLANPGEIDQIAEAHAEVAFIESGVNPLERDREGFLRRTLKRIEKERTFVVFEDGKLVFKADIVAETSDVIYLEGIFVAPEYRGKGVGSECLAKLSLHLLGRVSNICLLSNVKFKAAHRSFAKAGFKNSDSCLTLFV